MKIKKITMKHNEAQDNFARSAEENNKEIADLKKRVNETTVDKDLSIQYLKRRIEGEQSCQERL